MGEIIEFPVSARTRPATTGVPLDNDPYYRFIHTVLATADACGFSMPFSLESAVEHVYLKTRDSSELARLLREAR